MKYIAGFILLITVFVTGYNSYGIKFEHKEYEELKEFAQIFSAGTRLTHFYCQRHAGGGEDLFYGDALKESLELGEIASNLSLRHLAIIGYFKEELAIKSSEEIWEFEKILQKINDEADYPNDPRASPDAPIPVPAGSIISLLASSVNEYLFSSDVCPMYQELWPEERKREANIQKIAMHCAPTAETATEEHPPCSDILEEMEEYDKFVESLEKRYATVIEDKMNSIHSKSIVFIAKTHVKVHDWLSSLIFW